VKRRIVLLGPPAAGKGTQAALMKARYQIPVTSPGAMLREEKRLGTQLGIEAEKHTSQGSLVPDEMVCRLVGAWLGQNNDGFIFDGFPRSRGQADALENMLTARGTPLEVAISLEVPQEVLERRVLSRLVCLDCGHIVAAGLQVSTMDQPCPDCGGKLGRRQDDTAEILAHRMVEYREKSLPLIEHYLGRDLLHVVESSGPPETVFKSICEILEAA
jgi:adenylate kinase